MSKLNKTELETVSNYVLYGKDEDGTSSVDRKEIQIKTKFQTYKKDKNIVSLDELMENPAFDEASLQRSQTKYKKPKPHIDEVKAATIPEFKELKTEIDRLQHIVDVNLGKIQDSEVKTLT